MTWIENGTVSEELAVVLPVGLKVGPAVGLAIAFAARCHCWGANPAVGITDSVGLAGLVVIHAVATGKLTQTNMWRLYHLLFILIGSSYNVRQSK
jgi:hypothetical protein